jgi:hypothetical protein
MDLLSGACHCLLQSGLCKNINNQLAVLLQEAVTLSRTTRITHLLSLFIFLDAINARIPRNLPIARRSHICVTGLLAYVCGYPLRTSGYTFFPLPNKVIVAVKGVNNLLHLRKRNDRTIHNRHLYIHNCPRTQPGPGTCHQHSSQHRTCGDCTIAKKINHELCDRDEENAVRHVCTL